MKVYYIKGLIKAMADDLKIPADNIKVAMEHLNALERFATAGLALAKAFKKGFIITERIEECSVVGYVEISSFEELIKWSESEEG